VSAVTIPVTTGGEVPDALRARIASLYVDVLALNEALSTACRTYAYLDGAMDVLGDRVDMRAFTLCEETGMNLINLLLLNVADQVCMTTASAPQPLGTWPCDHVWPSTAWPLL
jgi:hypothetical protein